MRSSALFLLTTLCLCAQDKPADMTVYRVEFNIHDGSDAAGKAGRRYVILVEGNDKGVFRVGQRVPYATGSFQSNSGSPMTTQFSYADVGVNIECRVNEIGPRMRLRSTLDLSTLVQHDKNGGPPALSPTIGQLRIEVNALVPPGKPSVVASIDDPVTLRKFDVEATVTRVD